LAIAKDKSLSSAAERRRLAEERLHAKTTESCPTPDRVDPQRLIQELEVHQIELEMQNEELHHLNEQLELSRTKYTDLYEFAPVGYFTFDKRGVIREVNLTGAKLLGIERQLLANRPFVNFVADADGREIFSNHIESVLQKQGMQRCEISFMGKGGTVIHGQFQSIMVDAIESKESY
jgi:formate hydrogenlyase transcriptional activator